MNITIVGTGYVGLVTGASLANLGHQVLCLDVDVAKIKMLEQGKIPFYEQGLQELVLQNAEQERLSFTTSMEQGVDFGEVIFNCVGTPENGDGSANLEFIYTVTREVGRLARQGKVLVNKSTVPPGTAQQCSALLGNPLVQVVSNPEFLKQGNAVYDFNHPDKIVIGANSEESFQVMRKVYHGLIKTYIPLIETTVETAEMIKYANNSFLATKVSFINEIANICDAVGADIKTVSKAIGMDYRIGPRFLNAGIGYGGSCFPKDVRAIVAAAKAKGYNARLLQEVDVFNERQKKVMLPKMLQALRRVNADTVTLWGLSFKPRTSDMRGAPALELIRGLQGAGMKIKVYDPVAMEEARKILGNEVIYSTALAESVEGSNAIILVTEWDEFRNVSFAELGARMKSRILFDGRNIYEPEQVRQEGFEYYGVGRGAGSLREGP